MLRARSDAKTNTWKLSAYQCNKLMKEHLILLLLKISAYIPLPITHFLGRIIGWLIIGSRAQMYRVSLINLSLCYPNLTTHERQKLARASVQETGKLIMETGAVWLRDYQWLKQKIRRVHNQSILTQAIESKRGVILLVPHLGNWEVLGLYVSEMAQVTVMYQPPEMKKIEAIMRQSREKNGVTLAPTNRKGVMTILKALKAGGLTAILPDQVPDRTSGSEVVPFFNHPALTMTLVNSLRKSSDCLVIAGYAQRTGSGYEIHFEKVDEKIYSDSDEEALEAMNKTVERCINHIPEQYQWEYKRFRRLPGREHDIYKGGIKPEE